MWLDFSSGGENYLVKMVSGANVCFVGTCVLVYKLVCISFSGGVRLKLLYIETQTMKITIDIGLLQSI